MCLERVGGVGDNFVTSRWVEGEGEYNIMER